MILPNVPGATFIPESRVKRKLENKMADCLQLILYHWMAHKMNNSDQDSSNNVTCCQIKMVAVKFWLNIQVAYLSIFF